MTITTGHLDEATRMAALASTSNRARPLAVSGSRRAAAAVADLAATLAVVFAIPFVILAVGIPIALGVRLLLWIGGLR